MDTYLHLQLFHFNPQNGKVARPGDSELIVIVVLLGYTMHTSLWYWYPRHYELEQRMWIDPEKHIDMKVVGYSWYLLVMFVLHRFTQ